ncbi:MAG: hypothetical protein EOO16_14600 [Chitinophagaceae bacterium]|nr:MAG: hypothetical protein EOO16_14600 [Chitinophagaceae bacterium]
MSILETLRHCWQPTSYLKPLVELVAAFSLLRILGTRERSPFRRVALLYVAAVLFVFVLEDAAYGLAVPRKFPPAWKLYYIKGSERLNLKTAIVI